MLPLVLIFVVMAGLLSAGWQWPLLLTWADAKYLEMALRASWLTCIAIPASALVALLRPDYWTIVVGWLLFGLATAYWHDLFRATELTGQVALLALWIMAASTRPTLGQRLVVGAFAAVHGVMLAAGAVAKLQDPGWTADSPDVLLRVYGPWTVVLYVVPAAGVIAASWLVGRGRRD